jgi:hypothetical protein
MQILTESLSNAAMMLFGWRIAFLLGAFTGVVGVILRRRMPDPAVFLECKQEIEEKLGLASDANNTTDDRLVAGCHPSTVMIEDDCTHTC